MDNGIIVIHQVIPATNVEMTDCWWPAMQAFRMLPDFPELECVPGHGDVIPWSDLAIDWNGR